MHIDVEFRKKASDKVMILESFRSQKLSKNGHSFGISNRERVYTMVQRNKPVITSECRRLLWLETESAEKHTGGRGSNTGAHYCCCSLSRIRILGPQGL